MLPTMVRCRVRSTQSSTTCPSSSTAMRDSCLGELMTSSRDMEIQFTLSTRMTSGLAICFAGAISGGRADVSHYRHIVQALEDDGHYVLAGAVASEEVSAHGENIDAAAIWARDLSWIEEADVLVAEVSLPSTGVGYEVSAARYRYGKPVICLYRAGHTKRCSAMIAGDARVDLIEHEETPDRLIHLRAALAKFT